ncbi:MAG: hypothetical protein EA402_03285 [Planctomycetota bacterium]|nr:MAG: hypothetical protein EA402_03285 [Planctomycetota bacterium]
MGITAEIFCSGNGGSYLRLHESDRALWEIGGLAQRFHDRVQGSMIFQVSKTSPWSLIPEGPDTIWQDWMVLAALFGLQDRPTLDAVPERLFKESASRRRQREDNDNNDDNARPRKSVIPHGEHRLRLMRLPQRINLAALSDAERDGLRQVAHEALTCRCHLMIVRPDYWTAESVLRALAGFGVADVEVFTTAGNTTSFIEAAEEGR